MDRCAVFVDAGWLLSEVRWDHCELVPALAAAATARTGLPLLRVYWYDTEPDDGIAALADVKLRHGRSATAPLAIDLTTLARERAIADALVVSGDEDLREANAEAQRMGVRVTLGAVEARALAPALVQEADGVLVLDREAPKPERRPAPAPVREEPIEHVDADAATPREFGHRFGTIHADGLSAEDLRALRRGAPMIPTEVAARLFHDAEELFGSIRGRADVRRELKAGYWDHVMRRR
jgi:hypothetical protein